MSENQKAMTLREVVEFINNHPTWTDNEKAGVWSLLNAYLGTVRMTKGSHGHNLGLKWLAQLNELGIVI